MLEFAIISSGLFITALGAWLFARYALVRVTIMEGRKGVHYRRGRLVGLLEPGQYVFWKGLLNDTVVMEETRVRSTTLTGQEIVTKDQVGVRISVIARYRLADPLRAHRELEDYTAYIHQTLQIAIREMIASMTIEEALGSKNAVAEKLKDVAAAKLSVFGIEILDASIRDIILPGEIRTILAKTLEAEMAAKSNLVTAREELAVARTQANTAKLIADNPIILALKELQTIAEFAKKSGNTIVLTPSSEWLSVLKGRGPTKNSGP